ncbi:MAG TPA: formate dehydrogenase accessory sulfurtransferase FdhD [Spirochaetota bacterium]|nr:formate dehydrogenase accessory sulfurtransferase FdhD [Spirochaetota bacterium]
MDTLAVESNLTVIVNGKPVYYCMRMPGMDRELAAGLCFNDGTICSPENIISIEQQDESTVSIALNDSGCKNSDEIRIIRSSAGVLASDDSRVLDDARNVRCSARFLFDMQNDFFSRQNVYNETGATHAAGIYDISGSSMAYAEDVGRHNALDKCVGKLLIDNKLEDAVFCMLSSRLSYEMVMKGARAGVAVIAGVSAPTSFAVKLARGKGITLVGFLRNGRFNVYSGDWRINIT